MKFVRLLLGVIFLAAAVGCGKGDLNKDLKPVDPNAPRPKVGAEKGTTGDKPATPP